MTTQLTFAFAPEPNVTAERSASAGTTSAATPEQIGGPAPAQTISRDSDHPTLLDRVSPPREADRPATLAGCLAWLEQQVGCSDPDAKQLRGAVTTIAVVLHRNENRAKALDRDLPAAPAALRPLLANALPAAFKISSSRWNNAKSLLRSLLIVTGWVSPDTRLHLPLTGVWHDLYRTAPADPLSASIRPFLRFCQRRAVMPADITGADLLAYEAWLTTETLDLRPRATTTAARRAWRRLQQIHPAWPRQDLVLEFRVGQKAMAFAAFPPEFERDVRACMATLRNPDPLDPDSARPMAELSVEHVRRALLRAATYLVGTGMPATQITGIAVLVQPVAVRAIALALHTEGKPLLEAAGEAAGWTKTAEAIIGKLLLVARCWVKLPPEVLAQLVTLRKQIKTRRGGLSNRVQDRLADLATDEDRAELHALPWRAFAIADESLRKHDGRRAAKLHETALALAIVLRHPLRLGNLAALDIERHLVRDRRGRLRQISIPAAEVKNKTNLRFDLPDDLAARLERHIAQYRPLLPGHADSTALFPGENGMPRQAPTLGRHLRRLVEQQIGKRFHTHLARHLAVDVLLDADERNLPLAQKLLGHRREQTTAEMYGGRVTLAANRKFGALIRSQAERAAAQASPKHAAASRLPSSTRKT